VVRTDGRWAAIIDRVSFEVGEGEVLGLVGESGCGKSTMVKTLLGVLPPSLRASHGKVMLGGRDLLGMKEKELSGSIRAREIGFVPQDPGLALNPMFRIGDQLLEIWKRHAPQCLRDRSIAAGRARLIDLFKQVQLPDPEGVLTRYPHQFSGGQRQRVLIAAALLCHPKIIIADEPTTALDVTIQQQILQLLRDLATRLKVGVLFVTHDFGVVSQLCDRVVVMYAGQVVETGDKHVLLKEPKHPYTIALLDCHPDRMSTLQGIPGTVPPIGALPTGCRFHPRCNCATPACPTREAKLVPIADRWWVNCVHAETKGVNQ
jgi:oligopeptide/dipeptide ABC transporter ATP-binding protein